jgi:hypothetical protein
MYWYPFENFYNILHGFTLRMELLHHPILQRYSQNQQTLTKTYSGDQGKAYKSMKRRDQKTTYHERVPRHGGEELIEQVGGA